VDDGPEHDLRVGNRVILEAHPQRGGYCFTLHVPVTISKSQRQVRMGFEPDGYSGRIVRVPNSLHFPERAGGQMNPSELVLSWRLATGGRA